MQRFLLGGDGGAVRRGRQRARHERACTLRSSYVTEIGVGPDGEQRAAYEACPMENTVNSVRATDGFLVADAKGHVVGHVESPMYGKSPTEPDAIAVRSGTFLHRHFLVPASAIDAIDETSKVVGLRLERRQLQRFL